MRHLTQQWLLWTPSRKRTPPHKKTVWLPAQVCGNDKVHVRPEGPGGIPEGAALTPAGLHLWHSPPPVGRGQNDGSVVGQISGAPGDLLPRQMVTACLVCHRVTLRATTAGGC